MNYENLLHEHRLKITPQRLAMLSIMYTNGHINVEDLFIHIKKSFTTISLATLYKNINAMLDKKLISEVKIPNMKAKYEISKGPHIHMLCTSCHEFIDLELDLYDLVATASLKSHYSVEDANIILSGLCEHCKNK